MPETPCELGERRPIASRDRRIFQVIARWLGRLGVSPNAISVIGMLAGLASGLVFSLTAQTGDFHRLQWILGAILAQIRLLANMFDGMVAIETRRASPLGELFNEVPDRISDSAIFIGLGYASGGHVVLGYAAACAALFTAYVRAVGKVAGASQEFCGPMAKPQRMFVATLAALYLGLAPASWQWNWGLPKAALTIIVVGSLLTAFRRLARAGSALNAKRATE